MQNIRKLFTRASVKILGWNIEKLKTMLDVDTLEGADLRVLDLRKSIRPEEFNGLNLAGADLYYADLRGVDLSKTLGLEPLQLAWSHIDETTTLPEGMTWQDIRQAIIRNFADDNFIPDPPQWYIPSEYIYKWNSMSQPEKLKLIGNIHHNL